MNRTCAVVWCASVFSAVALAASPARAGADQKIAAEELFDEGKRLMVEGKFAVACDKLEQSERIDPGVGTLLYLAECYEKSGRTASAWATFREASSAARAGGQAERARVGQERAARLEPLLVRLTVNVAVDDAGIAGFTLKRSTEVLPQSLWGTPVPVDPGDYNVEATAPGYETITRRVTVGKDSVSVDIPALHASPETATQAAAPVVGPGTAPQPAATPAVSVAPVGPPPPPADSGGSGMSGQRVTGLVVAGAGLIAVSVGAVYGVNAISNNDDAKKDCPRGNQCNTPRGAALSDTANRDAVVANVTVGLGAAALVGGGLLYFLAPSARPSQTGGVHFIPAVGLREVGAFAEGRF